MIKANFTTANLEKLNHAQYQAVTTIDKPLLLLAGAGSGKTRVITYRIAYLIACCQIPSSKILALTFTNKAAKEMYERVKGFFPKQRNFATISTFHALCVKILRQYIECLGYHPNFVIYDTQEQQALIKNIMEDAGLENNPSFTHKQAHYEILKAKGLGIKASQFLDEIHNHRQVLLGNIYQEYNRMLKGCNALDFEDILYLALELLENHQEYIQPLLTKYQYILVDEYQDTNRVQYKILQHLIKHSRMLCVVGDDDQSIYSWRGADLRNILDFKKDYPDAVIIPLEQNYRSSSMILAAANSLIAHNTNRMSKSLWTNAEEGELINVIDASNEYEELQEVTELIKLNKYRKGWDWSSFAILYRSNHQSRMIEEELREEGIPYQLIGGIRFFERKEVQDCLAYMKFIHNPLNEVSLHRIINYPKRGIGKTSLMKINAARENNQQNLFEIMQKIDQLTTLSNSAQHSITTFIESINQARENLKTQPFNQVFHDFFEKIDIQREIEKTEKDQNICDKKVNNFFEFLRGLDHYVEKHPTAQLGDYLEYIALFTDSDNFNDKLAQVTLMTVHAAKGLEFDSVNIIGLTDEQFPNHRAVAEKNLEEERRLFYVAMTRARHILTLSYARVRKIYGEWIENTPSRFLQEISSKLLKLTQDENPHQKKHEEELARQKFFQQLKNRRK